MNDNDFDGGYIVTDYKGKEESIIIPETIDGLPVKAIGKNAFFQCTILI